MFGSVLGPRQQGDLGELSAMVWLSEQGYDVYLPLGHSPDVDMVAGRDGRLLSIQVKTSRCFALGRWQVSLATRGGNRSWSGEVKRFSSDRCDALFVLVADGRRWFMPARSVEGACAIHLGGPKYAAFEIDRGRPFRAYEDARSLSSSDPRRGTQAVNGNRL
jgi:hypothetical protein